LGLKQGTGSEKPTSSQRFMAAEKPEVIIDCRKSGGILANNDFQPVYMDKSNNQSILHCNLVWRVYFLEVLASIQTGPAKKKII
jgi:hypothetical protein